MKFREIREAIAAADNQAIEDFEERANNFMRGPVSLEEQLSFIEHRRWLLAGAVGLILAELIEREEAATP